MLPGSPSHPGSTEKHGGLQSLLLKRPHFHPARCKVCGRHGSEVGGISQTGLCPEHSKQRFLDNLEAMKTMSGPYARNWRRRMAASVGALLVDDVLRED